jgi:hypothetical protein
MYVFARWVYYHKARSFSMVLLSKASRIGSVAEVRLKWYVCLANRVPRIGVVVLLRGTK